MYGDTIPPWLDIIDAVPSCLLFVMELYNGSDIYLMVLSNKTVLTEIKWRLGT